MPTNKVERNEVFEELKQLKTYLKKQHKRQKHIWKLENINSHTIDKNEDIKAQCTESYKECFNLIYYLVNHPTSNFNTNMITYKNSVKKVDELMEKIQSYNDINLPIQKVKKDDLIRSIKSI